jgi:hypothetical protein
MKCRIGDAGRELRHAAEMVAVPMRRDEVVDRGDAGVLHRGHDAIGIPRPWVAGVDENRFAGRRDEECRVAAFHVDEVHLQALRRCLSRRGDNGEREGERQGQWLLHSEQRSVAKVSPSAQPQVFPGRNTTVNSFNGIQTFPSHSPFGMNGRAIYARVGRTF